VIKIFHGRKFLSGKISADENFFPGKCSEPGMHFTPEASCFRAGFWGFTCRKFLRLKFFVAGIFQFEKKFCRKFLELKFFIVGFFCG